VKSFKVVGSVELKNGKAEFINEFCARGETEQTGRGL
jgi:hypothetical protein